MQSFFVTRCLQVVPGAWVDDVTATGEMIFDSDRECTQALYFFCLQTQTWIGDGNEVVCGMPPPPLLSCDADMGSPVPGGYIIFCDNLFLQTMFWTQNNNKKMTFSEGH